MSYWKHFLPMNLQPFCEADGPGGGAGAETPPAEGEEKNAPDGTEDEAKKQLQAEAQKMADAIVAKKLKSMGMPSKEDAAAFKEWLEKQKTPEQKESEELARLKREAEEYKAKATAYENEKAVIGAGVPAEFAEFVAYKVGQKVTEDTDFDTALKAFVKDNPQYKGQTAPRKTGLSLGGGSGEQLDDVEKAFFSRNPDLKKE